MIELHLTISKRPLVSDPVDDQVGQLEYYTFCTRLCLSGNRLVLVWTKLAVHV